MALGPANLSEGPNLKLGLVGGLIYHILLVGATMAIIYHILHSNPFPGIWTLTPLG